MKIKKKSRTITISVMDKWHCANDCLFMILSKCRRKNKSDRCDFGESRKGPWVQLEKDETGFNRRSDICLESFDYGEWE